MGWVLWKQMWSQNLGADHSPGIVTWERLGRRQKWAEGEAESRCSPDKALAHLARSSGTSAAIRVVLLQTKMPEAYTSTSFSPLVVYDLWKKDICLREDPEETSSQGTPAAGQQVPGTSLPGEKRPFVTLIPSSPDTQKQMSSTLIII